MYVLICSILLKMILFFYLFFYSLIRINRVLTYPSPCFQHELVPSELVVRIASLKYGF